MMGLPHSNSEEYDDDVVLVTRADIEDFNPGNILPEPASVQASIISRLSPTEYSNEGSEYQKHLAFHMEGTCDWVFSTPSYTQWHDQPPPADENTETKSGASRVDTVGNILWIRGVAGSGKSVLTSAMIRKIQQEEKCPVLYFFFRHGITANHSPTAALRDWLAQALPFSPPLQAELKRYIRGNDPQFRQNNGFSSLAILFDFLRLALEHLPKAYVFVDALDEMDPGPLGTFLQHFNDLAEWRPREVKLIMTSRPLAVISNIMRSLQVIDIPLDERVESDLAVYLSYRLDSSSIPVLGRKRVAEDIMRQSGGLFLYAKLAVDLVLESLEHDSQALTAMPVGLAVLYSKILQQESERTDIPPGMQQLILKYVTHATRPLRLLELSDLINFTEANMSGGDLGTMKALVRAACGPLLQILPDETVHVAHHSVTEFLSGSTTRKDSDSLAYESSNLSGPTHHEMALSCISYLRERCLDGISPEQGGAKDASRMSPKARTAAPPFTQYAALNWHVHARKSMSAGHDQAEINAKALELFDVKGGLDKIASLSKASEEAGFTPLGLATSLKLACLVQSILEQADATSKPVAKEGPLRHAAKAHDDAKIVQLLLKHGADPTAYNKDGQSALHLAASHGRHQAARALLDAGVSPFIPDTQSQDDLQFGEGIHFDYFPAHSVFGHGDVEMVSLFLTYLETTESCNWALEQTIMKHRRCEIIQRVLEHPLLDVNGKVNSYTPLYAACSLRYAGAIEILLKAGADANILHDKDSDHVTPSSETYEGQGCNTLHALASHGHPFIWLSSHFKRVDDHITKRCFELILAAGATLTQADAKGLVPLHVARDVIAIECLLEAGADPSVTNRQGETLLHLTRNPTIMRTMRTLAPGMDINAKSRDGGSTPLLRVLKNGCQTEAHLTQASQLLDFGADTTVTDKSGSGTLHYAVGAVQELIPSLKSRGLSILKRLIAGGADVNLRNSKGRTPTHVALPGGSAISGVKDSSAILEILLAAGADMEIRDSEGHAPLSQLISSHSASGTGSDVKLKLAEMLVAAGARVDTTGSGGRNLLHCAVSTAWPDEGLIRFLVAHGIDPRETDSAGNTIWHLITPKLATTALRPNLISELVSLNVDIHKANNSGELPIHIVVKCHPDYPVFFDQFINLCGGENIDGVDGMGATPLHIASTFSEYLTRRLLEEGADIGKQITEGLTVLHLAARSRDSNVLGLLLAWLSSGRGNLALSDIIDARDSLNRSPLYYACASGQPETVQMLLEAGASTDADSYAGSPWQGCVALHDEGKDAMWRWRQWGHDRRSEPAAAGVSLEDTARLRIYGKGPVFFGWPAFTEQRLDEIVELLVLHGAGGRHLDQALASAIDSQFDHATECLLRVREDLGLKEPYILDDETSRRLTLRTTESEGKPPTPDKPSVVSLLNEHRYSLAKTRLLQEPNLRDPSCPIWDIWEQLAAGGFASLIEQAASHEESYRLPAGGAGFRMPLLNIACYRPKWNMNVVRLLVEKLGADVNACKYPDKAFALRPGHSGKTPTALHFLVRGGRWWQIEEALPYLLSRGADTEAQDKKGLTPLAAALESIDGMHFRQKAVETLLEFGADPNAEDSSGRSCLSIAGGNREMYELLIQHGATVSPSTILGIIKRRDVSFLEAALASGADPNTRKIVEKVPASGPRSARRQARRGKSRFSDDIEKYPLELVFQYAYSEGDPQTAYETMLKILVQHGANASARYEKTTIMHRLLDRSIYTTWQSLDVRAKLLDILLHSPKLDLEARDDQGRTLLHLVASQAQVQPPGTDGRTMVQVLFDLGADIRAGDSSEMTVLHHLLRRDAAPYRDGKYAPSITKGPDIRRIIKSAPDVAHSVDNKGRTPLHTALDGDTISREDLFAAIDSGCDITSSVGSTGDSVLHLLFRHSWVVKLNGDIRVAETPSHRYQDSRGTSGNGDYGEQTQSSEQEDQNILQRLLVKSGLDVNARNKQGKTPVFGFFERDNVFADVVHETDTPSSSTPSSASRRCSESKLQQMVSLEKEHLIWEVLDDLGADWTATTETGTTLLHALAEAAPMNSKRRVKRFEFLMSKGLDVMQEYDQHRTPLDVAATAGRDDILGLFK